MSQPPDEPPYEPRPDEPPPQGPPHYGQPGQYGPPYHYGQPVFPAQPYSPPPSTGTTNLVLGLLLGGLIGVVLGGVLTFAIFFATVDTLPRGALALAILLPFLLPVPLLFFKNTRPWAAGLLMGIALGSVVLAGSCVWILSELEQAH